MPILFILAAMTPLSEIASANNIVSCTTIFAPAASNLDGIAGWGTKLLPSSIFKENVVYQKNMQVIMNAESSTITPYWSVRGHQFQGPFDALMTEWSVYFSATLLKNKRDYSITENGIEHHLRILELRSSGTEANNYFYELAGYAYKKRTGKTAKRPQLLFFANPETGLFPYGGTSGRSAEMSIRYTIKPQETLDHYLVPSPQTKFLNDIPEAELLRLRKAEDEAINFIRGQVNKDHLEIGGIILEPISVSKGIHFFRKEFLLRLRSLADELGIPIMADEIFTGGGRTGQFWAFQHYEGFYPDLISFGKGLELKGVGWIQRKPVSRSGEPRQPFIWNFPHFNPHQNDDPSKWSYDNVRLDNTSVTSAADAARAVAIIETIQDKNLVESAQRNGAIILQKLRSKAAQLGLNPNSIQGIGLVFHLSDYVDRLFPKRSLENYEGRVTPLLTTEPKDLPAFRED